MHKNCSKVSRDHYTMTDTFALSSKWASCVCFINPEQDAAMNKPLSLRFHVTRQISCCRQEICSLKSVLKCLLSCF